MTIDSPNIPVLMIIWCLFWTWYHSREADVLTLIFISTLYVVYPNPTLIPDYISYVLCSHVSELDEAVNPNPLSYTIMFL